MDRIIRLNDSVVIVECDGKDIESRNKGFLANMSAYANACENFNIKTSAAK